MSASTIWPHMPDPTTTSWLEISNAGRPPQRLDLAAAAVRLGRGSGCEVRAEDAQVCELHAEIRREGRGFSVHDLASKAGLFVNGARTYRRALHDGDVIELGRGSRLRLVFHAGAPARPEPPAPTAAPAPAAPAPGAGPAQGGRPERSALTHLARFFEVSRKLGGAVSLDEVLCDVVDLAIDVTRAERGLLVQLRGSDGLELRAARDANLGALATEGLKISETLVRRAIQERAPLVVADVGSDEAFSHAQSIVSLELRSAVILPLTRFSAEDGATPGAGDVFGVLYLDSRRRSAAFATLDMRLLERLAQDASAALEHARLLREAQEMRRIEQEVRTAREVQAALMPEEFVSTPTFEIAGSCVPCLELGGDYVDQFDLVNGRTALIVADVCGKGIAASLLAAALQGALVAQVDVDQPLGELVGRLNRGHCSLAPLGKFVTMVLVVLEPDGVVQVVNAGHCPPLLVSSGGITPISTDGMALGLDEDATYRVATVTVPPGGMLVLYTDGVVECEGQGRELYGQARLEQLLLRSAGSSAGAVLAAITQDTEAFRGGVAVSDDLSVIVVRRR